MIADIVHGVALFIGYVFMAFAVACWVVYILHWYTYVAYQRLERRRLFWEFVKQCKKMGQYSGHKALLIALDVETERMTKAAELLENEHGELDALRAKMCKLRDLIETAVCTEGCDKGIVLLSQDAPVHSDPVTHATVYDLEYFSPLGECLIECWQLTEVTASYQEVPA